MNRSVNSFSSIESAYESTGEVEEPGFWLKIEGLCDVVMIGHSEERLGLLFSVRSSKHHLEGWYCWRSGEVG